jgi:hypothetical protein
LAAFVDPRFINDAIWVLCDKQMAEDAFNHLVSRFKLSGAAASAYSAAALELPPRNKASSGLLLRPTQPGSEDREAEVRHTSCMEA